MLDFFSAKDIKDKSKKSSLGQVWNFRHTFQTCHGENKMYENKIQVKNASQSAKNFALASVWRFGVG